MCWRSDAQPALRAGGRGRRRKRATAPKARILVVEDDAAIAYGLQKNLQFEGYEVLVATDGEAGLQQAVDGRPDLIILDIMLPRMNGFEICETLRKKKIDVPVIFLTAKTLEATRSWGSIWAATTTSRSPSACASSSRA